MMKGLVLLCMIAGAAAASVAPLDISGEYIPDEYIVVFREGADVAAGEALAASVSARHVYSIGTFHGFAAKLTAEVLMSVRLRTDIVKYVVADGVARTNAEVPTDLWGLQDISTIPAPQGSTFIYPDAAGDGTVIYVVDTGIRLTHEDFGDTCGDRSGTDPHPGCRAEWGARFGSGDHNDGNGHGTHCASTAGGTHYGVARNATLVAVGVLGAGGSGAWSDVMAGIDYGTNNCAERGHAQCVQSLSLGGGANQAVDDAVTAADDAGQFMAIAAGNNNQDAQNYSPARAAGAFTVMAHDINRNRASFSNYGSVSDISAPGVNVQAAWSTSDSAYNTISGTSMACPHVAGVAANALAEGADMKDAIISTAAEDALNNYPAGTPNLALTSQESY